MTFTFINLRTLVVFFAHVFSPVNLQFGVYGPHMFPPPIYPPPVPMMQMAGPMPAPMPMMAPFLIPVSSEEKSNTTTTTTKKPKKKELALAFPVPVAMPMAFLKPTCKPTPEPQLRLVKPKKTFAVPVPMMPPAPVVGPSPIIVAPIAAPALPPRRPWRPRPRPRPRPGWSSDRSFSRESLDISSSDSEYRRPRRPRWNRQRRRPNYYRRNLRSSESDNELLKPMLSYIADNGDIKFETKISNDDVAELLGEKELVDRRSETVQVLTRGNDANRPKMIVVSKNEMPEPDRQSRIKQVSFKGGVSNHVLREGKKELVFRAPDNKKISNLSLTFQIS